MSTRAHIDFYDDYGAGPVHLAGGSCKEHRS